MTSRLGTVEEEILDGIRDMYDAFLKQERARFDSHLDPTVSTWESHLPRLYSREELNDYRDRRTAAERPNLDMLRPELQQIDVWGETAVARYLLLAKIGDGPIDTSRVTDVLRLRDGAWRIVHHHSEHRDVADDTPAR